MPAEIENGYVFLARNIKESAIFSKPGDWLKVWIFILTTAAWKDKKRPRGTLFLKFQHEMGVSQDSYQRAIKFLREEGMIKTARSTRGVHVEVLNFAKYQDADSYKTRATDTQPPRDHHAEQNEPFLPEDKPKPKKPRDGRATTTRPPNPTIKEEGRKKKKEVIRTAAVAAPTVKKVREKADPDELMTLEQFVADCDASPERRISLIGAWAEYVRPDCRTRGQWQAFLKRHLRPAMQAAPFTDEQIAAGFQKLRAAEAEGWLRKPTLETLIKFMV